jgi:hypothetical protein
MVACAFAPQLHLSGVQRLRRTRASYPRMQSAEKALQRTPHFFMARLLRLGWVTGKVEESTTAWKQPDQSDSFRRGDLRGVTVRALSAQELSEGSKLEIVARLCVSGMFGVEKEDGSSWVLRNFNVKYGEDSASGRQSVMLVAETDDGEIVGCCGMELMLLTEQGMGWYTKNNPGSIVKKRPFVSDLVVDTTYRCQPAAHPFRCSFLRLRWPHSICALSHVALACALRAFHCEPSNGNSGIAEHHVSHLGV